MSVPGILYPRQIEGRSYLNGNNYQNLHAHEDKPFFQAPATGAVMDKKQADLAFAGQVEKQNAKVRAHEEAHRLAAGPQAVGSPQYQTANINGHTVITGGHQVVNVPAMVSFKSSKPKIQETIRAAEYTIAGAEAPASFDELSAADKAVAARGRAVLSAARTAFGKRGNLDDRLKNGGHNTNGALSDKQVARAEKSAQPGQRLNFMI